MLLSHAAESPTRSKMSSPSVRQNGAMGEPEVSMPEGAVIPRTRQGSPPSLLLNIFGSYWWGRSEPFPSAALVTLLADFGVSDVSARAALSRMQKHGLLVSSRSGRNTAYVVSPRAVTVLLGGLQRFQEFGQDAGPWDGLWRLVALTTPENQRSLRDAVRGRLRWLGFAALNDGVWVSPHDRHDAALAALDELGISNATLLTARVAVTRAHTKDPRDAWDLTELAQEYREFIRESQAMRASVARAEFTPAEALVERTRLGDRWLDFARSDPDLPTELLPADWPRAQARVEFHATHRALGQLAIERVREIVSELDPSLGALVTGHEILP